MELLAGVLQKTHLRVLASKTSAENLQSQALKGMKCLCTVFVLYRVTLSVSGTPGSGGQGKLSVPWINGAFFITVQNPTKCAKKCRLLSRKGEYPQPSLRLLLWTVVEGWICQMAVSTYMGQRRRGAWAAFGDVIIPLHMSLDALYCCEPNRPPAPGNRWVTPQLILLVNGENEQDLF